MPFIFERLTRIDTDAIVPEERRDTRRRESLADLTPFDVDPEVVRKLVNLLADARLLTITVSSLRTLLTIWLL